MTTYSVLSRNKPSNPKTNNNIEHITMSEYIRTDKNNRQIVLKIKIDTLLKDWVNCKLYTR